MEIRNAKHTDIDALMELSRQIGQFHFENAPQVFAPPSKEERDYLLNLIQLPNSLFRVAIANDSIIGFITAKIDLNETVPFIAKTPICRIGTIVVDEAHHSSGVGKDLMSVVERWAKEHAVSQTRLEVMSFNSKAKRFYQSLGFEPQSEIWAK